MELEGRTCLVTGASRGIGHAIAAELAKRPVAKVLAGVRDPSGFDPPPGPVEPVELDLAERGSIVAGWERVGGRVDVLINNAGQFEGGKLEAQDPVAIDAMVQVNLTGLMQLTRLALPPMLAAGEGSIVNNASISGYVFMPGSTTYAATKAGVVGFSESLRRELRGTGVGVLHLVTPGCRDRHARLHTRGLPRQRELGSAEPEDARGVGGASRARDRAAATTCSDQAAS